MAKLNPSFRTQFSRRRWLQLLGLAGASVAGSNWITAALGATGTSQTSTIRHRSLRLAQISDIHLQPELGAAKGFAKCLHHIQSQTDAPALILNSGDCIMDAMAEGEARTRLQWELWQKVLREECSLPVESALGNHDYWGINRPKSGTTGEELRWGKRWALDELHLERSYRSFDRAGWHFIVLDSVEPYQDSYKAQLGPAQMEWLRLDLEATPKETPVLVMSHIPIVSAGGILNGVTETPDGDLKVSGRLMHLDSPALHKLFRQHGNVRLCLSGHLHILDRVEYDGITYLTSGAVSSNWWRGIRLDRFDYGYAMVDLFDDGSFSHQYLPYGWKTVQEKS